MGRSRRRARTSAATAPPPPRTVAPAVLRKTLGAYLAGAVLIAILVLLGILILQGTLGPWLVLVADAVATFALFRWAQARLADLPLSDEDRIMQTLAGGLLAIVLLFAAVAAVVITASS
jgi:cytochrome b561